MTDSTAPLTPTGDRLAVKPFTETESISAGGIHIPDMAKERPQQGVVVAIGAGRLLDNGSRGPMEIKLGDRIMYGKYSGSEIYIDKVMYLVLREPDVLAVLPPIETPPAYASELLNNGSG